MTHVEIFIYIHCMDVKNALKYPCHLFADVSLETLLHDIGHELPHQLLHYVGRVLQPQQGPPLGLGEAAGNHIFSPGGLLALGRGRLDRDFGAPGVGAGLGSRACHLPSERFDIRNGKQYISIVTIYFSIFPFWLSWS